MTGSLAGTTRMWDSLLLGLSASRDSPSDLFSREVKLLYIVPQGDQAVKAKPAGFYKVGTLLLSSPTHSVVPSRSQASSDSRGKEIDPHLFMRGADKSHDKE